MADGQMLCYLPKMAIARYITNVLTVNQYYVIVQMIIHALVAHARLALKIGQVDIAREEFYHRHHHLIQQHQQQQQDDQYHHASRLAIEYHMTVTALFITSVQMWATYWRRATVVFILVR